MWITFAIRAALVLAIVSVIWWGVSKIYNGIYDNGVNAERTQWQEKEVRESSKRNAKIAQLVTERENERAASDARISVIALTYAKEIEDAHSKTNRDVAAAHAGALKLHWATKLTKRRGDDPTAEGGDVPATRVCNDSAGGELPPEITADLFTLANDADRNTKQLDACQDVIVSDRVKVPISQPN